MGIPHRNYAPRVITRRPHHDNQPFAHIPRRDEPGFSIILPVIPQRGVLPREHVNRIGKIQPAMR